MLVIASFEIDLYYIPEMTGRIAMNKAMHYLEEHRSYFFDIVRIYLGLYLVMKGLEFTGRMDNLLAMIGLQDAPFIMGLIAHYVLLANIIGGVFLVVGLITRGAALVNIPNLLGALYILSSQQDFFAKGSDLPVTLLVAILIFVFTLAGAGPVSLDHAIQEYMRKHNMGVDTLWEKIFHHKS